MKTTTEYSYNDDEQLSRVVTTEEVDCNRCEECEDGELLTSEVEVTSEATEVLAIAALALATVSLCLTAASAIFKRH